MRSLDIIFQEEYQRQKELILDYKASLKKMPKGSISIKKINNKKYAYLKSWENGKTKTKYIGIENSKNVETMKLKLYIAQNLKAKIKLAQSLIKKMETGYRATN
jgi:hypothetical protein